MSKPSRTSVELQALLDRFNAGQIDAKMARDEIFEIAYEHLKGRVHIRLVKFGPGVQSEATTTLLVHDHLYERIARALDGVETKPKNEAMFWALVDAQIRYTLLDIVRIRDRHQQKDLTDAVGMNFDGDSLRTDVLQAVERLPDELRKVVDHRYFGDRTVAEVAQLMGISTEKIKDLTKKAEAKLWFLLKDYRDQSEN